MRRSLLFLVLGLVVLGTSAPAEAGEDLTAMTNTDRSSRGLGSLTHAPDLQAFAQRRAEEMAGANALWHTANLGAHISNWLRVGENVGRGPSLADLHREFMNSGSHRENILHPAFSQMGVGVATKGYFFYVVVVFREPSAGPAPPPPRATPPPRPAVARQASARPRPAAPKAQPAPDPAPAPVPEPVPAPEPPPVEIAAPPPEPPPPPVAAPAPKPPLTQQRWFLSANAWDSPLPADPAPDPMRPAMAGALLGLVGMSGGVHHGLRRWLLRPRAVLGFCGATPTDDTNLPTG